MPNESLSPKGMDNAEERANADTQAALDRARPALVPDVIEVVAAFDSLGGFEVLDARLVSALVGRGYGLTQVKDSIVSAISAGVLDRVPNGGIVKPLQAPEQT